MKIAFACDHGGFPFREPILQLLHDLGHEVVDLGPSSIKPLDDFPEYSRSVCQHILGGLSQKGILVCGTGVGMSIAANRYPGIRAVLAYSPEIARLSRSHNDANVICFGARTMVIGEVFESIKTFLATDCLGEKYERRNNLIENTLYPQNLNTTTSPSCMI